MITSKDGDWWEATNLKGDKSGKVPSNYVEPCDAPTEAAGSGAAAAAAAAPTSDLKFGTVCNSVKLFSCYFTSFMMW